MRLKRLKRLKNLKSLTEQPNFQLFSGRAAKTNIEFKILHFEFEIPLFFNIFCIEHLVVSILFRTFAAEISRKAERFLLTFIKILEQYGW